MSNLTNRLLFNYYLEYLNMRTNPRIGGLPRCVGSFLAIGSPMGTSPMNRSVWFLAGAQALFQTASVLVMTIGGLVGARLSTIPELATLPIATMFLGTAVGTFPAALWMARVGRKPGFLLGAGFGLMGGLIAAFGAWIGSLALVAVGTCFVGMYQAFAQFYRFAAGELADPAFQSRAIALVLGGGIIAALAGPALARRGVTLFSQPYVGSFCLLALVSLMAIGVLVKVRIPAPTQSIDTVQEQGRPWRRIVHQPTYLVALFGALTGYGVMILAMTATPIAMTHAQHTLADSASVIQLHVLGMFVPSFFTGTLIARFGALRIMGAGIGVLASHVLMTMTGTGFTSFAAALILLGLGWNFLYLGGTTLLTTTYRPVEKARAQATNDMVIFVVGLICSFSAGGLVHAVGWQQLNLFFLPWLGVAAAAVIWLGLAQRRTSRDGADHPLITPSKQG